MLFSRLKKIEISMKIQTSVPWNIGTDRMLDDVTDKAYSHAGGVLIRGIYLAEPK